MNELCDEENSVRSRKSAGGTSSSTELRLQRLRKEHQLASIELDIARAQEARSSRSGRSRGTRTAPDCPPVGQENFVRVPSELAVAGNPQQSELASPPTQAVMPIREDSVAFQPATMEVDTSSAGIPRSFGPPGFQDVRQEHTFPDGGPSGTTVNMMLVQENILNSVEVVVQETDRRERDAEVAQVAMAAGAAVAHAQAETSAIYQAAQGAVQHAAAENAAQKASYEQHASALTNEYRNAMEAQQAREVALAEQCRQAQQANQALMAQLHEMQSRMEQQALDHEAVRKQDVENAYVRGLEKAESSILSRSRAETSTALQCPTRAGSEFAAAPAPVVCDRRFCSRQQKMGGESDGQA